MRRLVLSVVFCLCFSSAVVVASSDGVAQTVAQNAVPAKPGGALITIFFLRQRPRLETISALDTPPDKDAIAGAELGALDNNTTGQFTNQRFVVNDVRLEADADLTLAIDQIAQAGATLVLADLPADRLLAAAALGRSKNMIFFNIAAPDDSLREKDCRRDIFHVAPSRAMLADALAQYLAVKQWRKWLLLRGSHNDDSLLANAYRASAKKFGAKIVEERLFEDMGGGRRADSGSVQAQRQILLMTQNTPAYDVVIAADENEVFAGYLPYRTFDPRPVAGSAGLMPTSWDPAHEQWGATQLQNRFAKAYKRTMRARDAQAWIAMRMIGEGATRTQSAAPQTIAAYLLSPDFSIAGFKGQKLSLRPWDLQLRQPILLSDGRSIVSISPQEGFLHQTSMLDTLGRDKLESSCLLQ